MHHNAYVLLPKREASTSKEARQQVMDQLINDPSFVGEGGRFGSPICDWFVIGGRWSGDLYSDKLQEEFFGQVDRLHPGYKGMYSIDFIQENRKKMVLSGDSWVENMQAH